MGSVTEIVSRTKQPRGGYIKPSQFEICQIEDQYELNDEENITPSSIGTVVDYLTRLNIGIEPAEAFGISCRGAQIAEKVFHEENAIKKAGDLLAEIKGLDAQSIMNACELIKYDLWLRNPMRALMNSVEEKPRAIIPDEKTIHNIQILSQRGVKFLEDNGPIVRCGFTFEPDGYTDVVDSGDGDYLTKDTLWDFKVRRSKITSKDTLQLFMYWMMGQNSGQDIYDNINKIGVYNPRLNVAYTLDINAIPTEVFKIVARDIICY